MVSSTMSRRKEDDVFCEKVSKSKSIDSIGWDHLQCREKRKMMLSVRRSASARARTTSEAITYNVNKKMW